METANVAEKGRRTCSDESAAAFRTCSHETATGSRVTTAARWKASIMAHGGGVWSPSAAETPAHAPPTGDLPPIRRFGKFVTSSAMMREAFDLLNRFAATDVPVTLLGETGTGKDVVARALHERSSRASGPFTVFDCGAIAPTLAESELFGHERGAFTGAFAVHAGAFERAHGGTLFLDEIGELPLHLQPRLLRVLENRRVRRVGGTHDRLLDVRIIAATHRNLRADVTAGRFRQDLYFRLGGAVVSIPPLRERFDDLPLLVAALLEDLGRGDLRVSEATLAIFRAHVWPGNVRELKNALACAVAFVAADADLLEPLHVRLLASTSAEDDSMELLPLGGQKLEHVECAAIRQTLAHTEGNRVQAAQMLGIAVSTLYEKLKKYRLTAERPPRSTRSVGHASDG